jgi:hypothetical protein
MDAQTSADRRGLHDVEFNSLDNLEVVRKLAQKDRAPRPTEVVLVPGNYELLSDLRAASRDKDLQFVYLVSPSLSNLVDFPVFPTCIATPGGKEPIINLARPDRFPELYRHSYWHDDSHLNEAGASVATKFFADELKKWYANQRLQTVCGD